MYTRAYVRTRIILYIVHYKCFSYYKKNLKSNDCFFFCRLHPFVAQ